MQQMKKIILILLIGFSLKVFAQDPQLFENTWYLHNLIINGDDNFPPSNSEVPFITVSFNVPMFETYVCDVLSADINYTGNSEFELFNAGFTFDNCDNQENTDYDILYLDGFYLANISNPYAYTISSESNGSKTLTINANNGDQAIYNSMLLSKHDFSNSKVSVYPIPTRDELNIQTFLELNGLKAKIFDLNGKLRLSQNNSNSNNFKVNVQELSRGIYFLVLENKQYKIDLIKFIKL